MFFRCLNIQAHYNEAVIYLNFGTPKIMNFPFGTNGKFIILGVPILKHIRVYRTTPCYQTALQETIMTLFQAFTGYKCHLVQLSNTWFKMMS